MLIGRIFRLLARPISASKGQISQGPNASFIEFFLLKVLYKLLFVSPLSQTANLVLHAFKALFFPTLQNSKLLTFQIFLKFMTNLNFMRYKKYYLKISNQLKFKIYSKIHFYVFSSFCWKIY